MDNSYLRDIEIELIMRRKDISDGYLKDIEKNTNTTNEKLTIIEKVLKKMQEESFVNILNVLFGILFLIIAGYYLLYYFTVQGTISLTYKEAILENGKYNISLEYVIPEKSTFNKDGVYLYPIYENEQFINLEVLIEKKYNNKDMLYSVRDKVFRNKESINEEYLLEIKHSEELQKGIINIYSNSIIEVETISKEKIESIFNFNYFMHWLDIVGRLKEEL